MEDRFSLETFAERFPREDRRAQILHLLLGATRAPSTHNCQPWRFRIKGDEVEVHRDDRITLPQSDGKGRYAYISIGFLLQHLSVLGSFLGMRPAFLIPADVGTLAATVRLSAPRVFDEDMRPLAHAIFARRNRRGNFKPGCPIPSELLDLLSAPAPGMPDALPPIAVAVSTDAAVAKRIGELTHETMARLYGSPAFRREMSAWITPTGSGRRDGIPGFSLNQPLVLSWLLPAVIRFVNIGNVVGAVSESAIASASALAAFGSEESPASWLAIGFQSSHGMLSLRAAGYDASVFVASAELPNAQSEATRLLGLAQPLQFLFAAGVLPGAVSWRTARLPLTAKLMA